MRVALITDIHGNELALKAVLRDIELAGADMVACLGDTATLGPKPVEVLHMLRDLGCPVIMGNHDEFLLDASLVAGYTEAPVIQEAIDWCSDQLGTREREYVSSFQERLVVPLDDRNKLMLFHGSPISNVRDILATTPGEELDEYLAGHRATVMAGGHTHVQMLRQHRGSLLVNPGSVGMPFKEYVAGARPIIMPYAEYAMIHAADGHVGVDLRRVELGKAALRSATASWLDAPGLLRDDLLLQYA